MVPGPEPKKASSAYFIFNTEFCADYKRKNPATKQSDCFKLAGEKWGAMSDKDKEPF